MSDFIPFREAASSGLVDFRCLSPLLSAALVCAGLMGGLPHTTFGQGTQAPACSEPSPCPTPDTTQNPEVACFEPHSSPIDEDVTLHIYGRHLTRPDEPPTQLIYRDTEMSGSVARTNDDIEVKSACHVVTTLHVKHARRLSAGDSVEFRLQREQPTPEEYKEGSKGAISDWYYVEITESETSDRSLQVTPSATAAEESPCDVQDPSATSIGDLSGRHHMNTVRLEGIVAQTNAKTGSDKNEYALQGETGTLRVTTSTSLPAVDTWYSVTGEVSFNPSEGGEYLKEQRRSSCE